MTELLDPEPQTHSNPAVQGALVFLFERIKEQAGRSGVTVEDEDAYYLERMPWRGPSPALNFYSMQPPPDPYFENFRKLAIEAYQFDRNANPDLEREWKRALAIMKLNDIESTAAFLKSIGVELRDSLKDGLMLLTSGVMVVLCALGITLEKEEAISGSALRLMVAACAAIAVLMFLRSKAVSKRFWTSEVDRLSMK